MCDDIVTGWGGYIEQVQVHRIEQDNCFKTDPYIQLYETGKLTLSLSALHILQSNTIHENMNLTD